MFNFFNLIFLGEKKDFEPHDIAIDSLHRLIFWDDEATNQINILKLDQDEEVSDIGLLLSDDNDKPRAIAIHSKKALIFWVNVGSIKEPLENGGSEKLKIEQTIRIERSLMDGSKRKTVIDTEIAVPTDICIDQDDNFLFWVDIELRRLERSDLDGKHRRVLVRNDDFGPEVGEFNLGLVTVHGEYVYWAVRNGESIKRINKRTGLNSEIVKSNVIHLSSLISVNSDDNSVASLCQGKYVHNNFLEMYFFTNFM